MNKDSNFTQFALVFCYIVHTADSPFIFLYKGIYLLVQGDGNSITLILEVVVIDVLVNQINNIAYL